MRVLVTGAGGFVGRYLLPRLGEAGAGVVGVDREVDVTVPSEIAAEVRRVAPDAVVHLAAQSSVAASWADPVEAFRINFLGALNLLGAVQAVAPSARVLLVGSSDVYGRAPGDARLLREDAPLRPDSPYARTKAAAEQLGVLAVERGLDVVRVRSFTHTGAGQSDRFVASSFARQIAEIREGIREPVLRVGNLDSVRDFLDVRDVVDAYARLLAPEVPCATYNVASGRGVSIRGMLELLMELAGVSPRIEVDPERFRPPDHRIGDATRLREATGWCPRVPLRETLRGLLEDWGKRLEAGCPSA